jgi:DMSO/TMAO reductase YedYZ molybdopterin-dependent catalytic subunit
MQVPHSLMKIVIVGIIALVIVLYAFTMFSPSPLTSPDGTTPLAPVEVRSYNGEDLSSIRDFHENSIKGPQHINESDYRLTVTGLTNRTLLYSYRDVLDLHTHYSKVVTLRCVEGWHVTILWEGVLVRDLLHDAGIDPRAKTVIFTAQDGYTTSFPIEYLVNNDIIMAYRINNVTLPDERGFPFQLVAEDKWGYKWIKWIDRIELSDDTAYRGYSEERGYSNSGDLAHSFFSD